MSSAAALVGKYDRKIAVRASRITRHNLADARWRWVEDSWDNEWTITQSHTQTHKWCTCAQYWDLATAARSLSMGWDWDTRGETAWMTAVNFGYGLIPETQQTENTQCISEQKQQKEQTVNPSMQFQAFEKSKAEWEPELCISKHLISIFSESCSLKPVCQHFSGTDYIIVSDGSFSNPS